MRSTRRTFLASGMSGVTLLAGGWTLPGFLTRTARAAWLGESSAAGRAAARDGRILVVVQLTGGNDGLNTVIPYADDLYHRARPTLRVAPDQVLKLDDHVGLHPELTGLRGLYDDGRLAVVNNVGYPNPDRSHFRSMDIWHTADPLVGQVESGWLGRVADLSAAGDDAPAVLHLDSDALPAALKARQRPTPSIRDVAAVRLSGGAQAREAAINAPRGSAGAEALFVQRVAISACANARRIEQLAERAAGPAPYPGYGLAQRLQQIAQLIGAEFGPRVYYTSLAGFDTHARRLVGHGPLLRELGDSVAAFLADLGQRGIAERVTLMTFSEFGRRVAENGSQGTDHGAAAPLFLAGAGVRAGVHGGAPDLQNLLEGDLRHAIDFRSVYATVLDQVLGVAPEAVLGGRFAPAAVMV